MEETIRGLKILDIYLVNPSDRDWVNKRYDFAVGAYGENRLSVYANNDDSALEILGDYLEEWLPGLLCTDEVNEEYNRLLREAGEDADEDALASLAAVDTIQLNDIQYIDAWELQWTITEVPCNK